MLREDRLVDPQPLFFRYVQHGMVEKKARVRRTAKQTRQILVAEGLRQLQRHGVQIGLDHITLEAACAATDVPRSSSHSAWAIDDDYTPQALFQRTVLNAWLTTREDAIFASAAQDALVDLHKEPDRDPAPSEVVRAAIQAAFLEGLNAGARADGAGAFLSTDLAIRFAIASQPEAERDEEILAWLREGEVGNRSDRIDDSYKPLAALLGLQPRAEYGERAYVLFGIAVASLVEGIGLRYEILPELALGQPVVPTPDGGVDALLIGVCVEALIPAFFEPVDDDS